MPDGTLYNKFVDMALNFQGCFYIWQGKGSMVWTPKGLQPHNFYDLHDSTRHLMVFDCSGLVTTALWLVTKGKVDLRASHSAKTILDTFPLVTDDTQDGTLHLWPGHVDISLGRNRVIDAHGGDHTTTSIGAAISRDAKVSVHPINRTGLLGIRKVPLDLSELRAI